MGRPPCCDRVEVKRGPWTPEEDIMLVSYVQEHGPGNWRSVSSSTGLQRCSKSCRLRWTNYLRPGIKRGSFTDQEEKMIIQLQALLGNKWAAIASYLPERTDNDIKNYWNTHLRRKLRKLQEPCFGHSHVGISSSRSISSGQWERRLQTDVNKAKQDLNSALSLENPTLYPNNNSYIPGTIYASSTENISRLLQGWLKDSPNSTAQTISFNHQAMDDSSEEGTSCGIDLSNATFESILGLESEQLGFSMSPEAGLFQGESKLDLAGAEQPFSVLENWLLEEGSSDQVVEEDLAKFSLDECLKLF